MIKCDRVVPKYYLVAFAKEFVTIHYNFVDCIE